MKIYTNTNIMNAQIFHFYKYDLKGHKRSSVFLGIKENSSQHIHL